MILEAASFVILMILCFIVLEDFIFDFVWLFWGPRPIELTDNQLSALKNKKQKTIAIMIANWHEENVLHKMVVGNIQRLQYSDYVFFLGVYPNDLATLGIAEALEKIFPDKVRVVVNRQPGPTSKGQMLNEIARYILLFETEINKKFDVFLMQDSEDVLHPKSLQVINADIERADFLQLPVFSFPRSLNEWVGAIYMDEFAEIHTKDILLREKLGAAVPSAGVGTALSRQLAMTLMTLQGGQLLNEESLTEDYVLGLQSKQLGFKTAFCCYQLRDRRDALEFIATHEFFPNTYSASVRQKTRWIIGIVFQSRKFIKWSGSFFNHYFIYRDRRAPFINLTSMAATTLTIYLLIVYLSSGSYPSFMQKEWFVIGSIVATVGMAFRFAQRVRGVVLVSGWDYAWPILLRWPLANFINFAATYKALLQYTKSRFKKEPLKWSKTEHELPKGFGDEVPTDFI